MRSDCWQAEDGHCYAISLPWPAYWPLLHWLLSVIILDLFMNVTAKIIQVTGVKLTGLGVALLGYRLN